MRELFRLFVSYSSTNRPVVETLVKDCEALGFPTWYDRELTGGANWWASILDNIRRADCVLIALTPDWLKSQPSRLEFNYAVALNRHIMPVIMGDISVRVLPSAIQRLQLLDYRQQDKAQLIKLVNALLTTPSASPLPDPLPPEPEIPLSPLAMIRDMVEAPALSAEAQQMMVEQLKPLLQDSDMAADARDWLIALGQRRDLAPEVAAEIQTLLKN